LLLVLLTTFITPICILACWEDVQDKVKEFMICLLFLETGMIGVFVSLDLFLFMSSGKSCDPHVSLDRCLGNPARRIYAAVKFFIFTMVGSLLMLVAILVLYFYNHKVTGVYTFDLLKMYGLNIPFEMQFWMFLAFGLAFAIKVPCFRFTPGCLMLIRKHPPWVALFWLRFY